MPSSAEVLSMHGRCCVDTTQRDTMLCRDTTGHNSANAMMTHDSIGDGSTSINPAASSHPAASSAWELAELFYEVGASSANPATANAPISRAANMATKTAITSLRVDVENHALKERLASQEQLIQAQRKEIEGLMGLLSAGMHRRCTKPCEK